MKKYMKPAIEVANIENECSIMAASYGGQTVQSTGLSGSEPSYGGENTDGVGSVGARPYYSIWDD